MCNFWSALVCRDGRIIWDKNDSSHETLKNKSGLKDDKLENRDFVGIEISPIERINIFSKERKDWQYKVDEQGTLPEWYTEKEKEWQEKAWKEWENAMKQPLWKLNLKKAENFVKKEIPKIPYLKMTGKIRKEWHMSFVFKNQKLNELLLEAQKDAEQTLNIPPSQYELGQVDYARFVVDMLEKAMKEVD